MNSLRELRHDLCGRANTLLLSACAFPLATDDNERLEFINDIVAAADHILVALDKLEALPEYVAADPRALREP